MTTLPTFWSEVPPRGTGISSLLEALIY